MKLDRSSTLHTQLLLVTALIILSIVFKSPLISRTAAIFGILFLFFPAVGKFFVKLWFFIGEVLGKINSKILLLIVYYIFLVPVSALSKLFLKDPMMLKKPKISCYIERNKTFKKEDLKNIW